MEPIIKATIQAAVLSIASNVVAQLIACHQAGHGYSLDPAPITIFVTYAILSCPPNYLWQAWLETKFPGYTSPDDPGTVSSIAQQPLVRSATDAAAPALKRIEETTGPALHTLEEKANTATTALADSDVVKNARRRATEGLDTVRSKTKELEARAGINKAPTRTQTFSTHDGQAIEKKVDDVPATASAPKKLNVKNTAIKFALDQTLGAFINNAMFIIGVGLLKGQSLDLVTAALYSDLIPLLLAGQKVWPLVSIISFTLVPLEHRTVFGGIVGLAWGVYLSLRFSTPGSHK